LMAEPGSPRAPGPLVRATGELTTRPSARFPWSWRLFSGPVRRFFDSVAAGWDERVRSDSPEYLAPPVAALNRLEASPGRILDIGIETGTAALEPADHYPDAEVVGIDFSAEIVKEVRKGKCPYQPPLIGTFNEVPNKAEHPGLMTERAGPVMNSSQLRSSERGQECG
jgi:SAM-dependent methyltransferase